MHKDLNMMTYSAYNPNLTNPTTTTTTTTTAAAAAAGGSFSSGFEIMPNISTSLTNYSSPFPTQECLVGSMYFNHNHSAVKKNLNLIMFGSEGSCSTSSDGSCNNNQISYESRPSGNIIKQEEMGMGFQVEDQNQKFMMLNYGNSNAAISGDHHSYVNNNNQWGERPNGYNGNTHFGDYDLEDVKQLISSNSNNISNNDNGSISNSLFSVDENKTDHKEKVVYFY